MSIKYKLIVQKDSPCLDLLKYLDKNIVMINKLGAYVHVEKISDESIDEELIESLNKHGITRLPAMIDNNGTKFIGIKKIKILFEKNISVARAENISSPHHRQMDFSGNTDLTSFYQNELMQVDEHGKMTPRNDTDEGLDGGGVDFNKKMSEWSNRAPARSVERDIEPQPERNRGKRDRVDNIAEKYDLPAAYADDPNDDTYAHVSTRPTISQMVSDGPAIDDMDRRMIEAMFDNNL